MEMKSIGNIKVRKIGEMTKDVRGKDSDSAPSPPGSSGKLRHWFHSM
jgi:hypothetical protein